eukprot:SAG31_NODE_8645_length_1414_cov_1.825856_2_plen_189_part_00
MFCSGKFECYECQPKQTPKSFPVCTIRATPDKPEHLVVFGKHMYEGIFGDPAKRDSNPLMDLITGLDGSLDRTAWARSVFTAMFDTETRRLLTLEDLWKTRTPPKPLVLADMECDSGIVNEESPSDDHTKQTVVGATRLFLQSAAQLKGATDRTFDKDDALACQFVTAAANLRGLVYGMETMSPFKVR